MVEQLGSVAHIHYLQLYCLLPASRNVHPKLTLQIKIGPQAPAVFRRSMKHQKTQTGSSLDRDKVVKFKLVARELTQIHTLTAAVPVLDVTELLRLVSRREEAGPA